MNRVWTTIPTGCPGYHTLPTSFVWHPENMYTTEVSENSQDIPRPWNIRKWVCFKGFSSSFLLTRINYPVQRMRFQTGDGWRLDRRVPNSKNTKTHGPRHSSKLQTSAEQECIASLWAWRKINKIKLISWDEHDYICIYSTYELALQIPQSKLLQVNSNKLCQHVYYMSNMWDSIETANDLTHNNTMQPCTWYDCSAGSMNFIWRFDRYDSAKHALGLVLRMNALIHSNATILSLGTGPKGALPS